MRLFRRTVELGSTMHKSYDPVEFLERDCLEGGNEPGWYFWDETWACSHGPFMSEAEAREQLERYCDHYL